MSPKQPIFIASACTILRKPFNILLHTVLTASTSFCTFASDQCRHPN